MVINSLTDTDVVVTVPVVVLVVVVSGSRIACLTFCMIVSFSTHTHALTLLSCGILYLMNSIGSLISGTNRPPRDAIILIISVDKLCFTSRLPDVVYNCFRCCGNSRILTFPG
jgi:hypothetical protein